MHGTTSGLRTEPTARLTHLERQRPEWHAWLKLLSEIGRALDNAGWCTLPKGTDSRDAGAGSSGHAPLLHGRTLVVDAARIQRLVQALTSTAAAGNLPGAQSLRGYRPSVNGTLRMMAAAVRQDQGELGVLARETGVDSSALASVAHLAAVPVLQSCGRALESHVPRSWPHGHCPICASWPILAERRGLDRTRRLRCGRCGGEWEVQWLCCIYCGERQHERLGSLVPEDQGELLKVETCQSCRGYLKSVATLQRIPPFELLLQDLETVEFDLVALDREYRRPEESGFSLDVALVDAQQNG